VTDWLWLVPVIAILAVILIIGSVIIQLRWPNFLADNSDPDCYK